MELRDEFLNENMVISDDEYIEWLERRIEKMKCCDNCKHFYVAIYELKCQIYGCKNYYNWELKESE